MENLAIFKISTGPWPEYRYSPEVASIMLKEYAALGFLNAREGDPEIEVEAADLHNKINYILNNLRSAEKIVLKCVYWDYDNEIYESPFDAAADAAEISPERARVIHKQLIKKLRHYLSNRMI